MSRGGARHFAKPCIDPGILLRTFKDHANTIKDLGTYETISKSGAVNPQGLLHCKGLLQDIIEIAPTCQVGPQVLRTALMQLLTQNVSLNNSKFNGSTWANIKSERLTVLLAHCRKVARDKEQQRVCAGKLTAHEYQQLHLVVSGVVLKDEDEPLEKGKVLKRKVSDASLDSNGWPAMFQSPKDKGPCKKGSSPKGEDKKSPSTKNSSPEGKKKRSPCKKGGQAPEFLWRRPGSSYRKKEEPLEKRCVAPLKDQDEQSSSDLLGKMGYGTKKKPAAKAKEEGKTKTKPVIGKKSLEKGQNQKDNETKKWASLRVTNAKNPERSYITGCHKGTTQRRLIAEVQAKWTNNYKAIVAKLKEAIEKKDLTKAEALLMRSQLLKKEAK